MKLNGEKRTNRGKKLGPNRKEYDEPMVDLHMNIESSLRDRADFYADRHGTTRSNVIRTATEIGMRFLERKEQEKVNATK